MKHVGDGRWVRVSAPEIVKAPEAKADCNGQMTPPADTDWISKRYPTRDAEKFSNEFDACATIGTNLWAGTSFYSGEGYWGTGALVRKDVNTGDYKYIHDEDLERYSTSHMTYFSDQLWIGTTRHLECGGIEQGYGVLRFRPEIEARFGFGGMGKVPEMEKVEFP